LKLTRGAPPRGIPSVYVPVKFPAKLHAKMQKVAKSKGQTISEFVRASVVKNCGYAQDVEEEELG